MTIEIEVRAVRMYYNDRGERAYIKLANADIYLPELTMHIRDVTLTWSKKDGFIVMAPLAETQSGYRAVTWFHQSPFCKQAGEAVAVVWRAMGGKLPEADGKSPSEVLAAHREAVRAGYSSLLPAVDEDEDNSGVLRTLGVENEEARRAIG